MIKLQFYLLEKIQRFETLLNKCMEKIKTSKERIGQLETENDILKYNEASKEDELDKLQVVLCHSCIQN